MDQNEGGIEEIFPQRYNGNNVFFSGFMSIKVPNGRIRHEDSVVLREALEPLYIQSRGAIKAPLIYTHIGR